MRIIAGKYKGYKLITPQGLDTRPTLDRAKETLFNIINFDIEGACCLDLFAGSGQIGLELLSRGAASCVFVDSSLQAIKCVKSNLDKLKLPSGSVKVLNCDARNALSHLKGQKFDIIYIDPPYQGKLYDEVLLAVSQYELLADNGFVICETDNVSELSQSIGNLNITKTKRVGTVNFVWYTKGENL